jgi:Putative peptidoglycan binding domain
MKTTICVCILVGLVLPGVVLAGKKNNSGGGKAASRGGNRGAAAHAGGVGGGGQHNLRGNNLHNGGQGVHAQRGLNGQGRGHGLNARSHGNFQNNRLGRNATNRSFRRFAGRNHFGHWRSGLRWRNSHVLFANYHRVWHDRWWWRWHYNRVWWGPTGYGYYYWDGGYWFPAWGYDPAFTFVYDGPIYSYANLPPDQVVVNVQEELQDQGYYTGEIDGQLGSKTRDAIGAYQRDHGLEITAAVDEPTVQALGLNS